MTMLQITSNVLLQAIPAVFQNEFNYVLYLPVFIWLFGIMVLFIFLLKRYTFGNWTVAEPNPYKSETLGMPQGIFRGILTMSLLFVAVLFEVMNVRLGRDESNIQEFMVAFQMMIAFYFGSKVLNDFTRSDTKKAITKAESNAAIAAGSAYTYSKTPTSTATPTSATSTPTDPSMANPTTTQPVSTPASNEDAMG